MTLIAEDLLLLVLDDEKGTLVTAYPQVALGGAVLVELAMDGAVEIEEKASVWRTAKVHPVAGHEPDDPLLRTAYDVVAEKERGAGRRVIPLTAQSQSPRECDPRGIASSRIGR